MPLGSSVSANIKELTKAHGGEKDWPRKRILAAAINAAREAGNEDVKPRPRLLGGHKRR